MLVTNCNHRFVQETTTSVVRTRMHLYTKRFIDSMFQNAFVSETKVHLYRLTDEHVKQYMQDVRDHKIIEDNIPKIVTQPIPLKETSHSEDETDTEGDSNIEDDSDIEDNNLEKESTLEVDDPTKEVDHLNESNPEKQLISPEKHNSPEKSKSPTKPKSCVKLSRCSEEPNSLEPSPKKVKLYEKKKTGNLKIVFSREGETDKFKSQLLFNNKLKAENSPNSSEHASSSIPSTSKCNENTDINCEKPVNPSNCLIGKIKVRPINTLIHESMIPRYNSMFCYDKKPRSTINAPRKACIPFNLPVNNELVRGNVPLHKIEYLYKKYFSKDVQDTIVIIANILNIISMSNKHHKARMDESFKKRSEAEKLKERCDANRQHMRHKNVLENKLKINFLKVIDTFNDSEFETTFQMFFLSILTVLRVLDQPKFKKGSIFKNLVLLLWNSLKNSDFEHPKVFTMFRSKSFRPECIDLISLIEDTRDKDPAVIDRMALFFVSTVNSREYFQTVIDAVTSDTNEDLGTLIETSSRQCCDNSSFKDPINYSSASEMFVANDTIPTSVNTIITSVNCTIPSINTAVPSIITVPSVNTTVPSFNNLVSSVIATVPSNVSTADQTAKHWVISKAPNTSNFQAPRPNTVTIERPPQKNNAFFENYSNSVVTRVPSDLGNNITIAPKPKVNVIGTPNMVGTVLGQGQATTFVAIKHFKPGTNAGTTLQRSDGNTIVFNNKQYQLIRAPVGQMRAIPQNVNILRKAPPLESITVKCSATNCTNKATIMCSTCTSVKYCSHTCQRSDWYDNHMKVCDQIVQKRKHPKNQ